MKRRPHAGAGHVRIIAGRWRNTRLTVPDAPGLRPSPDRVRETLFNWLMPKLPQAEVLDLFAGSGALGLEAVSRGAARATLIEQDPRLAECLRETVRHLSAAPLIRVVHEDALRWLARQPGRLADIAFVDPPFSADLWEKTLALLLPRLNPGAWLYLERPAATALEPPPDWTLHREGRTREVRFALYRGPEG